MSEFKSRVLKCFSQSSTSSITSAQLNKFIEGFNKVNPSFKLLDEIKSTNTKFKFKNEIGDLIDFTVTSTTSWENYVKDEFDVLQVEFYNDKHDLVNKFEVGLEDADYEYIGRYVANHLYSISDHFSVTETTLEQYLGKLFRFHPKNGNLARYYCKEYLGYKLVKNRSIGFHSTKKLFNTSIIEGRSKIKVDIILQSTKDEKLIVVRESSGKLTLENKFMVG